MIINSRVANFEILYLSFFIGLFLSFLLFIRLEKISFRPWLREGKKKFLWDFLAEKREGDPGITQSWYCKVISKAVIYFTSTQVESIECSSSRNTPDFCRTQSVQQKQVPLLSLSILLPLHLTQDFIHMLSFMWNIKIINSFLPSCRI